MTRHNDTPESHLPEAIRALVQEYHRPPATPRDEIWTRIETARRVRTPGADIKPDVIPLQHPLRRNRRVVLWAVGIAATLIVGIGLGRLSVAPGSEQVPPPSIPIASDRPNAAFAVSAAQHLSRTETLLTRLRIDPTDDEGLSDEARELLVSTRLMIDARVGSDAKLRSLLLDLEFILVQIVQLDESRRQEELELITDGLEQRHVLPRIRTAIPSGPIAT